ncbi:hypothetical protein [Hyalangium sp.]|uniref:hypothetical protein n=1 Tax=Hyalangium sp. TaxID=2028555 RepID=UPI002D6EE780|nr:hypothetical protein [Hyalangium sp.]HYI00117.1 hypothetical protein [Hyalangium sp.]
MSINNVNGQVAGGVRQASETSTFKASDALTDGKFTLDFEGNEIAKSYKSFITSKEAAGRVEGKMTEWVKSHPGADQKAFDTQLRDTLKQEAMMQNIMKSTLQKMMNDIEAKMKEMASDRFS